LTVLYTVSALLAAALLVYLTLALLKPEILS
jgi:K+-transporting ATPase KdpF subunit